MTAAALPAAGIRPATLVLLDPPAVPHALISLMASDPSEQPYADLETATARGSAEQNPDWSAGDVRAKAEALVQVDVDAARAVLLDNGDWDGGLADLSDPAADGHPDVADPRRPARRRLRARRGPRRRSRRGSAPTTS